MSTMIERVARAMVAADSGPDGSPLFDIHLAEFGDGYRSSAAVAIEAMREPTLEMVAAFWRQKNCGTQEVGETGEDRSDYAAWRAAIDAALKEGT